ncbi:MAG: tRNA (adenosine(37)-N6)-threonylcarbamoyltransferase complex ATPase subunit type 1 TsaE [Chloroflexi bacterium]|nr:tRNA (adenosine(37)-N6)-threonylcarbamoyltransferase complex ATPase subunit type 1 TsaE [Chloroflexota bacterium]
MSRPLTFASRSPAETRRLGTRLGRLLRPGDVVLLSGELGAGKTVFVQGVARGLGVTDAVTSKSFVLLGEYEGRLPTGQAGLKLYHADLYRLETPEEAEELALDEYCADGALVVEWPERAPGVFPPDRLLVRFETTGERTRTLTTEASGERARELLKFGEHRTLKGAVYRG